MIVEEKEKCVIICATFRIGLKHREIYYEISR